MTAAMTGQQRAAWLVTLLLVIVIPLLAIWPLAIASNLYDEKRLLVITLLLTTLTLFALVSPLRQMWLSWLMTLPVGVSRMLSLILLLGLLSAWRATLPIAALAEIALWIVLLAMLVSVAVLRRALAGQFDHALLGMIAFTLFLYLLMVTGYVIQAVLGARDLDYATLFINFTNVRFFNQFQVWTLPLAGAAILYFRQRGWMILQWVLLIALANWWMLLFLSGGRGALLALLLAFALVAVLVRHDVVSLLKWQALAALGGLLLFLAMAQLGHALTGHGSDTPTLLRATLSHRDALWQQAWNLILAHPWLGAGPMHYACSEPVVAGHPHNAPLQIAAEWGLPVLLLISVLVIRLLYGLALQVRQGTAHEDGITVVPALFVSVVAASIEAQVDGILVTPISQLMLAVVGGWLWGALAAQPAVAAGGRRASVVCGIVTAASMAMLLQLVSPLWRDVINGTIPAPDQTRLYTPRFWVDGALCREESFWRRL